MKKEAVYKWLNVACIVALAALLIYGIVSTMNPAPDMWYTITACVGILTCAAALNYAINGATKEEKEWFKVFLVILAVRAVAIAGISAAYIASEEDLWCDYLKVGANAAIAALLFVMAFVKQKGRRMSTVIGVVIFILAAVVTIAGFAEYGNYLYLDDIAFAIILNNLVQSKYLDRKRRGTI